MQDKDWLNPTKNSDQLPKLYSKNAIWFFSIFFSLVAGTLMMHANLKQLGNTKKATQVLFFGLSFILAQGVIILYLSEITEHSQAVALAFTFIGTALMYYLFWEKTIPKDQEFSPRPTIFPMIICLMIMIGVLLLMQQ